MGLLSFFNQQLGLERKATEVITTTSIDLPNRSVSDIRIDLQNGVGGASLNALQISAYYACARVIAEGLAQVPCIVQKRSASGGHEPARDHPLYDLLSRRPNSFMTSFEFREWLGFQLALAGNAFVFVARDTKGRPIELIPLAPGSVAVSSPEFGEVVYRLNVSGQPVYSANNIWHVKGASFDGVSGVSPQFLAGRALGLAHDLETFGSELFRNGATPSGILTTDKEVTAEQYTQMKESWQRSQSGVGNAHKTAVLTGGLKFQQMQTTADDAQFIESRRYQTEEICRIMRVDPLMVQQSTNTASYGSIEQRFLAHLTHTLAPWYQRFEQSMECNLLTPAEQRDGYRVILDTRSLTLSVALDRASYYASMRQNGLMTINECRDHAGLDRSDDPLADKLTPSANLFGVQPTDAQPKPSV